MKNDLPVLDSDHDFLSVFSEKPVHGKPADESCQEDKIQSCGGQKKSRLNKPILNKPRLNKHGLPVIDDLETEFFPEQHGALSGKYLKQKTSFQKKKPNPMPEKKRLGRYPLPEKDLDLHGFTAVGAEIKAKSFITTCKLQGFFTLRVIVGKGLHSDTGPVLPDVIENLLKALKKENIVLAYEWDRKKKSQSGAVIVYIKQFAQFDG